MSNQIVDPVSRCLYLRDYSKQSKQPIGCLIVMVNRMERRINYAFSVCSPKDVFSSERARTIAQGRLTKRPVSLETEIPATAHEITKLVMQHIVETNIEQSSTTSRSYRALQAASGWLTHAVQHSKTTAKSA